MQKSGLGLAMLELAKCASVSAAQRQLHAAVEQSIGVAAARHMEAHNPIEVHDGIAT